MDRAVCFCWLAELKREFSSEGKENGQGRELTKPQVQRTKLIETPMAEDLISGWQSEQSVKAEDC
jgi:hypothetical protein